MGVRAPLREAGLAKADVRGAAVFRGQVWDEDAFYAMAFDETFFREIPEARQWVQIGVDGRPIEYYDRIMQYYRWRGWASPDIGG